MATEYTPQHIPSEVTKPHLSLDEKHDAPAGSVVKLDEALATLEIDVKDADEAVAFLRDHPNADSVTQEALAILEDPERLKKLVRKINFTIVPCMFCVYFLQFLDKTTISYAAVMGLRTDTHLKGQDYSNASAMFYIGFLVAEFPTQFLAQRISFLGRYLGANVCLWGIVLSCMAAANSFAGLMIVRTLLGVFEACVAPILVLVIAMWYKKSEQGKKVSYFYVANSLTSIFGGCVSYGASFSHHSFHSWRIFVLAIGLMTIVIGAVIFVVLPDSPVKARRFTDAEKIAALLRVKENQSGTQAVFKWNQVGQALKDVRVWLVAIATMATSIPNGGISNFSSILLTTFGYTSQQALILSAPGGLFGVATVLFCGWLSDRLRDRSLVMLVALIPTIVAAAMMIGLDPTGIPIAHSKGALLFASYLAQTFGAAFMLLLAWNASNIAGHTKKVTANALTLVAFALGKLPSLYCSHHNQLITPQATSSAHRPSKQSKHPAILAERSPSW